MKIHLFLPSSTRMLYAHFHCTLYYTTINITTCLPFILDYAFFEFSDPLFIFVSSFLSLELSHNNYCVLSVFCALSWEPET